MTKKEKLIGRFLTKPKDFTFDELVKVLGHFDYVQANTGKTGGSRARFIHGRFPAITLHKPHPKPILKRYQIDEILNLLKQEKLL